MGNIIKNFVNDDWISFKEDTHQYFAKDNDEYIPVSNVIKTFKSPTDFKKIAGYVAEAEGKTQKQVQQEWDDKRDRSSTWGTFIHNELESFGIQGYHKDPMFNELGKGINRLIGPNYRTFEEKILHSKIHRVAGMTDKCSIRKNTRTPVLDILDYKTNLKGFTFHTIKKKNGLWKFYNRYMIDVLDHLEECDYNIYGIQLNLYAYMSELTWGLKIGRLYVVFIDVEIEDETIISMKPKYIPYMYNPQLAKLVLDRFSKLKRVD